uniref:O-fucosyltransferase family protein n=1 Tax=Erythrolobus madagascarensis TaxID=708628 RepID=A0A7S0T3R0_9RHOD|mmetsp:Transcript_1325/g.2719  ORF Transcript_1325/g.2719 Transcript_1325/m.2719 type:complete len:491 (+) Transcript_1325:170-1642(+)
MDSLPPARGIFMVLSVGALVGCLLSAMLVTLNGDEWSVLRNRVMKQSPERTEHLVEHLNSQNYDRASLAVEKSSPISEQSRESGLDPAQPKQSVESGLDPASSEPSVKGVQQPGDELSTRRRVLLASVFPDGYGNQLQGIHRLLAIAQCLPDTDVHLPPLIYEKLLPKNGAGVASFPASDIAASYYDTERIVKDLGVGAVLFASECRCFDYVVNGGFDPKREVGDASKPLRPNEAFPSSFYKDARYITPDDLERARTDPNALNWKSESCSTSNRLCVFLSHQNTHAIMKAARLNRKKFNSCSYQDLEMNRDRARSALLPSALVLNMAKATLPPQMKLDRLLVVHLRMRAIEIEGPDICKTDAIICLGRGRPKFPYKKVEIKNFVSSMKKLARANDCDHILPIVPRKFIPDQVLNAILKGFGLKERDLLSSRGMHPFYALLTERAIATQAKVYVAEMGSTMSETLQYQRRAFNMTGIIDLNSNSTVPAVLM